MNRQQRRNENRLQQKDTVLTVRERDLAEIYTKVKEEAAKLSIRTMIGAFALAAHDELGIGAKRFERIRLHATRQFEAIMRGDLEIESVEMWCKEHGIELK